MSSISNRFYITALEDGTTLHGNLAVDGSLSQAWNGQAAVPDWTDPTNQPVIYLTLLSGSTVVEPSSEYNKWSYNGTEITFDASTGKSITPMPNVFQKTTKVVSGKTMPALKIIANLANSENTDVDLISFSGKYIISGTGIDFAAAAQIRISRIEPSSSLGVINFFNGISDITEKGDTVTAYGILYNHEGTADETATATWFINDVQFNPSIHTSSTVTSITIGGKTFSALVLGEGDVVDHAMIRCDFSKDGSLKYSAYAAVDDMQDPEFMYIQYNGNNGNAASLRANEYAGFKIWVGTRTDSTVNRDYSVIKVKLLDGDGIPLGGSGDTSGDAANRGTSKPGKNTDPYNKDGWINACDGGGWRTLDMDADGKGVINVHYNTVSQYGKNLTGIILAETSN